MKQPIHFQIDTARAFPKLLNAPIVEAVIQWQAVPTISFEEWTLSEELKRRFATFDCQALHEHQVEAEINGAQHGMEVRQRSQWNGFRLTSADKKYVCQFKPNTVIFSRLAPYEDWGRFVSAATPFWKTFLELAAPVAVDRIGVRFISQVKLKDNEDPSEYIVQSPSPLSNIGLSSETFFHKDSTEIQGYPYRLNLVRVIQPAQPPVTCRSLIVDIDIVTTDSMMLDSVEAKLPEMRYLKNLVFFSIMRDAETKFS